MLHTWSLATEVSWYVALSRSWAGHLRSLGGSAASVSVDLRLACISLALPHLDRVALWTAQADLAGQLTYPIWLPAFLFCFAGGRARRALR